MRSSDSDTVVSSPIIGAVVVISAPDISPTVIQSSHSFSRKDASATSMESFVSQESLAQQVQAIYDQWITNLRLKFDPFDLEKFPVIGSPFEEGVRALQKCFQGVLPSTLSEIFSLLLIASVALVRLWHSIASDLHVTFFEDALEWHRAIQNLKEKQVFFKGIGCLFRLQPNYAQWQANHLHPASRCLDQDELLGKPTTISYDLNRPMRQAALDEEHMISLMLPEQADNLILLQRLQKGCVLVVCAKLLDRKS